MKVLIVEDSERLRRSLLTGLKRSGFAVEALGNGRDGLAYARHGSYDVIVLDLMLPGLDGLSVLRELRRAGDRTHVLILSARDQVEDRIRGLELGADDYLTKPFSFDELRARIQALVRRRYASKDPILRAGPVRIDTARREATRGDGALHLTPNEYAVLEYLAYRRGRVVSKEELLDHVHAGTDGGSLNAVEVVICNLRKKLRAPGEEPIILTRRGYGYLVE